MNFHDGSQPLVDAAFLAQGILRAPQILWFGLDMRVRSDQLFAHPHIQSKPQTRRLPAPSGRGVSSAGNSSSAADFVVWTGYAGAQRSTVCAPAYPVQTTKSTAPSP